MAGIGNQPGLPSVLTDEQLATAQLLPRKQPWTWVAAVAVALVLANALYSILTNRGFGWSVVGEFFFAPQVMAGLFTTLMLTAISMTLALLLGIIVAVAAASRNPVLSSVANGYIWIFRAIPLLVQIIFWYNLAALYPKLGFGIPFLPPIVEFDTNSVITAISAAIIAMSLNEGAYMSEIVRSGLNSVDSGQKEAARALGMSSWDTFRRIVMPQATRVIIPPTGNETLSMLKYTSLVSVIALPDLLYSTQLISSRNFEVIPMLLVASLWYLLVSTVLMVIQSGIERHFGKSVVRP
ncbi:amino acid ABC transporter permease [Mesorhizobium sp. B2-4-11]|uniref:amino acid ABC transporter permease n=1 Tax=Mesorhizobium sp. B2-4-11 TaxID=2589938 RepID=UPI00112E373E|nr:amino acid ABC transporter permease [Mesorhizobium sp. B2-4-11]TPL08683.1 amino acid ABC transporter permease [Mesorhizobium sp. B2-4-11]